MKLASLALLLATMWGLLGCQLSQRPTVSPTASVAPIVYRWTAPTVVAALYNEPGAEAGMQPRNIRILYSDGRLLVSRNERYFEGHLSHGEVCTFLAELDAIGFFNDNIQPVVESGEIATDQDTIYMVVNGWKTRQISHYALDVLDEWLQEGMVEQSQSSDVLLASFNRFKMLADRDLRPYIPERIVLDVYRGEEQAGELPWPLDTPLATLLQGVSEEPVFGGQRIQIEGDDAATLMKAVSGDLYPDFHEEGQDYWAALFPVYPHQSADLVGIAETIVVMESFQPSQTDWECAVQP